METSTNIRKQQEINRRFRVSVRQSGDGCRVCVCVLGGWVGGGVVSDLLCACDSVRTNTEQE